MNSNVLRNLTQEEEELIVGGVPTKHKYLISQEIKLLKNIRKLLNHKIF